jgi:hypothetical protein
MISHFPRGASPVRNYRKMLEREMKVQPQKDLKDPRLPWLPPCEKQHNEGIEGSESNSSISVF